MPSEVVVVVPTYNERRNLPALVGYLTGAGYRALIVDDASPDGTGDLADQLAARDPLVTVVHRPTKQGLGPAYGEGFRRAAELDPAVVVQMDADLSHDPTDVARLVQAVTEGADLAVGSRYVLHGATPDWARRRRLLSRAGNLYAGLMLGVRVRDATSGFRAFRPAALAALDPESCLASGYVFQVEMARRATQQRMRITEVPIVFRDRRFGESKMNGAIVAEAMLLVTRWGIGRWASRLRWRREV